MNNHVIIAFFELKILRLIVDDILSRSSKTIDRHDLNEVCLFF